MNPESEPDKKPKEIEEEPPCQIISVTIPEFNERYVDSKVVTFYTINITDNITKKNWTLEKRYNDFLSVYTELEKEFNDVPQLPKKTMFKVSNYPELLKRKAIFLNFMNECIKRKDLFYTQSFKSFLELDKNSPEIYEEFDYKPKIEAKLEDLPLGIRDFYYDKEAGVFFFCFSEMNIVSRTDTFLGNIKFPWEKGDTSHVAMGGCLVYRCQKIGENYKFQRGFGYSFKTQTGRVDWNPEGGIFSVGLDDGSIYLFSHDTTSNFNKFDEKAKIKPHKNRVMGIYYDNETQKIYSCSSDKLFNVTTINKEGEAVINLINKSHTGFTNIIYDKNTKRFFLTNEGGEILIFSNEENPPKLLLQINTSKGGCIRGLWMNNEKNMMFTASTTGRISQLIVGEKGNEMETKEIKEFGLKVKSRLVIPDLERKEVYTGDEVGRVTVWNLETGTVKCK